MHQTHQTPLLRDHRILSKIVYSMFGLVLVIAFFPTGTHSSSSIASISQISASSTLLTNSKYVGTWVKSGLMEMHFRTNVDGSGSAAGTFFQSNTTFTWYNVGNRIYFDNWSGSEKPDYAEIGMNGGSINIYWANIPTLMFRQKEN